MGVRGAGGLFGGGGAPGGGGVSPAFKNSVTDAAPGTTVNNYAPTGYVAGTTNLLLIAAAAGGTTITGLLAATLGWVIYIKNTSTADSITLSNLNAGSVAANQFSCPQNIDVIIPPQGGAYLNYVNNQWSPG